MEVAASSLADDRRRLVAVRSLALFARLGFDKVSFADISKATGVPRTALYRCFRSKREIFDASIAGVLSELRDRINGIMADKTPADDRLSRICGFVVDRLFEARDFLGAIFNFVLSAVASGEDMSERVEGFTGGLKRAFKRLVSEGISSGKFRNSVNPDMNAEMFFALMESVAFNILLNLEKDPRRAKRRLGEAVKAISA